MVRTAVLSRSSATAKPPQFAVGWPREHLLLVIPAPRRDNTYVLDDEGFYDCTMGICPGGHKYMVDD